jgi:hypothetical protein
VCVQADYMADEADDPTSDRFLEVYLLWLFGWVLFCESVGDSVSSTYSPRLRRSSTTPRPDAPNQLGQRYSGSYLHGVVFGSVEAGE